MIDVVWVGSRTMCWDQTTLDQCLSDDTVFVHHELSVPHDNDRPSIVDVLPMTQGAIVVVPARYHSPLAVEEMLEGLEWVVLVLTSDEESTFDQNGLWHSNMHVWTMTPKPGVHAQNERLIGEGTTPIEGEFSDPLDRPTDVWFSGQVTHARRRQALQAATNLPADIETMWRSTPGFTLGIDHDAYLREISDAKVAICPSGPATPDSFRAYEALELGAVPIVDGLTPSRSHKDGYWELVYPDGVPFDVIKDWNRDLHPAVERALDQWPKQMSRCQSWWGQQKRKLRDGLVRDAIELASNAGWAKADDWPWTVTAIVTTSPIPSHPSTRILEETLKSVYDRLPGCNVVIAADGVRPEQEDRRQDYEEYLTKVSWKCMREWPNTTLVISDEHVHQANTVRMALKHVATPQILFVEHDTPLEGDIDFDACSAAISSGAANMIRFHHESEVLDVHQYMMLDTEPQLVEGAPLLRTAQWSQRPHLASTLFYQWVIDKHFGHESRTMIEDLMHGVAWTTYTERGEAWWNVLRLWMYAPEGNIRRSTHLDGRESDPKFDMRFAYDGKIPEFAPAPTKRSSAQ